MEYVNISHVIMATPGDTISSALASYRSHLQAQSLSSEEITKEYTACQRSCLGMLADVHWRLGLLWQNWPYRLAQLVDPRRSQDEIRRLAEQIFDLPACCLDAACVRKLPRLYNGAEELLADGDFLDAVRLWSRRGRCTNMHIERCFALLRKAVEDPAPNVERVAAAGFLSQVRAEHRKAGGKDVGLTTREDLAREGVARYAATRARVNQPGRARGHITFMQERVEKYKLEKGGKLSRAEQASARAAAMASWRHELSAEERAEWQARAVAKASTVKAAMEVRQRGFKDDVLWGLAQENTPLRADVAKQYLAEQLECAEEEVSLTKMSAKYRQRMRDGVVVQDNGSLPVQETVIRHRACFEKHPGICCTRDKIFYKPIITALKRLERWLFEHGCLGAALQLRGYGNADEDAMAVDSTSYIAHMRKSDPVLIVVVRLVEAGAADGQLFNLAVDGGMFCPAVLSEIVADVWRRGGVHCLRASLRKVQCSTTSLSQLQCGELVATTDIDPKDAAPRDEPLPAIELHLPHAVAELAKDIAEGFAVEQTGFKLTPPRRRALSGPLFVDELACDGSASDEDENMQMLGDSHTSARVLELPAPAAPVLAALASPSTEPPPPSAAPRQARAELWGIWHLARLKAGGWGATCRGHLNRWDHERVECKKTFRCTTMPDGEVKVRMKLWLLAGVAIDGSRVDARQQHMAVSPHMLEVRPEAELDAEAEAVAATHSAPPPKRQRQAATASGSAS